MNERMRKRLVSQQSPDTRVLREAMRIASEHLDYHRLSARPPPLARRAGPQPRRLHRRRASERDRLSRRARLARAQADQGLVRGDEVAARLPAAAWRADGSDRSARALRQGRFLAGLSADAQRARGSRSLVPRDRRANANASKTAGHSLIGRATDLVRHGMCPRRRSAPRDRPDPPASAPRPAQRSSSDRPPPAPAARSNPAARSRIRAAASHRRSW